MGGKRERSHELWGWKSILCIFFQFHSKVSVLGFSTTFLMQIAFFHELLFYCHKSNTLCFSVHIGFVRFLIYERFLAFPFGIHMSFHLHLKFSDRTGLKKKKGVKNQMPSNSCWVWKSSLQRSLKGEKEKNQRRVNPAKGEVISI